MARLIVAPGTSQARQIILKAGVNSVGRAPVNDVTIEDGSVSSSHCQLIVSDGAVRIRDVGSTNGTRVNGASVTETDLQPGHSIQLGSVQLMFEADDCPVSQELPGTPESPPQPSIELTPPRQVARLRVAHDSPRTTAPGATTEAEPASAPGLDEPSPPAPVHLQCKYHPRTPAHWFCNGCQKAFCDLCVTMRASGSDKYCRTCSKACTPLQIAIEVPKQRTFFSELPRAVVYPFRGTGLLMLIGATIVFSALDFMSGGLAGIAIKAAALGYVFAYVQNIIHSTASGDDRLPELPAMDGLFSNFFRLVGTILISFGPALVVAYLAISQEQSAIGIALIPAIIFGCLYFPMAFLAVAIKDNVMAANPLVVVPSIVRVPLEYLVAAVLVAGVFGVRWLGDIVSGEMGDKALRTDSMSEMFLLFGLRMLWAFLSVYLLTAAMRILGILYLTRRDRLGW
jgi:hypothetical protein